MLIAIAFCSFFALIVAWAIAPSTPVDEAPVTRVVPSDGLVPATRL